MTSSELPRQHGRYFVSAPGEGAWNMAIDQAILDLVQADGVPTLRFYGWINPTLSLGYFQSLSDRTKHVVSKDLPLVRRSTGGGAIIHDNELTYSLCLPLVDRFSSDLVDIYRAAHDAIIQAFAQQHVFLGRFIDSGIGPQTTDSPSPEPLLCFQRRTADDLVLSGYKIVGSAQRRSARALLQHGSILLSASSSAPELPGVHELTSRIIQVDNLRSSVAQHLAEALNIQWSKEDVPANTLMHGEKVLRERFRTQAWNARRP